VVSLQEPPLLVRRLVLCAAVAVLAGSARAQMPNMMGQMDSRGPMPGAVPVDPNGAVFGASVCLDGKPRAGPAPKVVRVMPAPGSVVRPGAMVLSVTFDQPMACKANLTASPFPLPCPDGEGAVLISPDRRTLTTVCTVEAGAAYSMPLADFTGDGGAKSERYDLAFTTSTAAPVKDPRQAMGLEKTGPVRR
jgi:hypothetical protein